MNLLPLVLSTGLASGVNAYAVIVMLGVLGRFGGFSAVPDTLQGSSVLALAGAMFAVEFVTDKIPYVDTMWDTVSTVVRPTLGVMVGYLIAGQAGSLDQAAYGALGGGSALTAHLVKAGLRLAVNASPEPVTNITVSLAEDVAVVAVVVLALYHPWLAAILALVLLGIGVSLVIVLFRLVRRGFRRWQSRGRPTHA